MSTKPEQQNDLGNRCLLGIGSLLLVIGIFFDHGRSNTFASVSAAVARYPVGRSVSVHYYPRRSGDAVLENGQNRAWLVLALVGSVFVAIGLWYR